MAAEHAAQILPEKCSATDSQKESPFSAVYRKIPIRCRTTLNVGISKHTHKHYTQGRPNVDSDHSVFTKVYIECNFFCLEWVVKQGRFSTKKGKQMRAELDRGALFSCQADVVKRICDTGPNLITIPDKWLLDLDTERDDSSDELLLSPNATFLSQQSGM